MQRGPTISQKFNGRRQHLQKEQEYSIYDPAHLNLSGGGVELAAARKILCETKYRSAQESAFRLREKF